MKYISQELTAALIQELSRTLPSLRTSAQTQALSLALESLLALTGAICECDKNREGQAQKCLEMSITAIRQATLLSGRAGEIPPESKGPATESLTAHPPELTERETQESLLEELHQIKTRSELRTWYQETKDRRQKVVSTKLWNDLLDKIREKDLYLVR